MWDIRERKIKEIILEEIKKLMKNSLAHNIDITKIPIEILRQGYFDYRLVPQPSRYGDRLYATNAIREAIGDVLEADSVVNNIVTKYGIPHQLVLKIEQYHSIYVYVITACIGKNDRIIEEDMEKMGYFLGATGEMTEIEDMRFRTLQFEPSSQLQKDVTNEIKSRFNELYHWTPAYSVEDILREGLIPSHKNTVFNFPSRTYLMDGDSTDEQMWNLGQQLCINNNNPNNNGEYSLVIVNIENLDDNIRFFYDPNSEIGIFTEQPIPIDRIKIGKTVHFVKDLR